MTEIQNESHTMALAYRMDGGFPVPLGLQDSPPMNYQFGYHRGTALALDLFNWFAAYKAVSAKHHVGDRAEVLSNATEFIRGLMEESCKVLSQPLDAQDNSHRGQAVGMLDSLALLVASALDGTQDARSDLDREIQSSLHHNQESYCQGINHAMNVNCRDMLI